MSEPSQEPSRIGRARAGVSRWRNTRRGTKTLKAAYAQAARDVKRMDPAVRERIGRANLTKADLQMLADTNVARTFRPDRFGQAAQALDGEMTARVQAAGTAAAPTRNPIRRLANRVSRWRNTRQGTKALKAAYSQAARDVKRMDPTVRETIGRSGITKADLQALSQGHMDQVFRPEGRFGAVPEQQGQQQMMPPEQGGQLQQNGQVQAGQVQQMPQPQLQQMMQPQQDRTVQLLAEINQLQAQATQLLQVRIAQLQAEAAQLQALVQAQPQVAQQQQPEAAQQQQPEAAQQAEGPQQRTGGAQQPEATQQQAEGPQQQPEGAQRQEAGQRAEVAAEGQDYVGKHRVVETPAAEAQQPDGQQAEGEQPQAAENPDHVGKHRVVETQQPGAQQPAQQGPNPNNPQHWVDAAAGNTPVQPLPQPANQEANQEAGRQQPGVPQPANAQANLSPADMQNMHAAFNGVAGPQASTGEQARDTAAESEDSGQHRTTGQSAAKNTDSKLGR